MDEKFAFVHSILSRLAAAPITINFGGSGPVTLGSIGANASAYTYNSPPSLIPTPLNLLSAAQPPPPSFLPGSESAFDRVPSVPLELDPPPIPVVASTPHPEIKAKN